MKKISLIKLLLSCSIVLLWSGIASAIPLLQLDIEGGTYDTTTETIVATGGSFTLYALLTPGENASPAEIAALLSDTYYISAAVSPQVDYSENGLDLGSFDFQGKTYDVTEGMSYGSPPLSDIDSGLLDPQDLSKHGIFPTYFAEFGFTFDATSEVASYNTQDNPGAAFVSGSGTYWASFTVNTLDLDPDYVIHSDLYNTKVKNIKKNPDDVDVDDFAPFSHDAESAPIPEPATMLLFGTGLVGLAGISRRRRRKK